MNQVCFKQSIAGSTVALLILFASPQIQAQEHPEHPKTGKVTEKRESTLTPEILAEKITQLVQKESKLKGGYFLYYDEKSKKPLLLTLDQVHKDKLSKIDEGLYFACADFKGSDGNAYDLDFFMREIDSGLDVTELTVHKVNGKPRYVWVQKNGLWKREEMK